MVFAVTLASAALEVAARRYYYYYDISILLY